MTRLRTTALLAAALLAASTARGQEMPVPTPLAVSADGKAVAAGAGRSVRVYDTATGKLLRHLRGHEGKVNAIAFMPDGKSVVTVCDDKKARVFEMATGKETATFVGHGTEITCLAIAPDGKTVASAGPDQNVRLWDPSNGKEKEIRNSFSGMPVTGLQYSPDGKNLCWITGTIICWTPANQNQLNRNGGSGQWLNYMAYFPGTAQVATASSSRRIEIWDGNTGGQLPAINAAGTVTSLSAGGKQFAAAVGDAVQVFETTTRKEVKKLPSKGVRAVAFSPDGKVLASLDATDAVTLWDVEAGKESARLGRHGVIAVGKPEAADKPAALWEKLSGEDDAEAAAFMSRLAGLGDDAVKHAKEALGPIKADPDLNGKLKKFVADLDSDDFAARESATDALRALGDGIEPVLRDALTETDSVEARSRLKKLLAKKGTTPMPPEAIRALRAVAVLESIGTPAARELLGEIGKGSMVAPESREAQAALARLEKK